MSQNTSDPNITKLEPNEVFVFGSNESGRHGKGAAKTAMKWGAKYGQAEGLQGKTYGIPTVNYSISDKLTIKKIGKYVDRFIKFAEENPSLIFLLTEIGCGLAGHNVKDIAPLFFKEEVPNNVFLPKT